MIFGTVLRQKPREDGTGTPGRMELTNTFGADSLELGWHNNERGRSCTAAGVDHGKVWLSPALKRLVVRYADRNGRRDCLVHNGNWAGDEQQGEVTQIHGCTEVGHGYGEIQRPDGEKQWGVLHSGATLAGLIESLRCPLSEADTVLEINGEKQGFHDVQMTYVWAEGCSPE